MEKGIMNSSSIAFFIFFILPFLLCLTFCSKTECIERVPFSVGDSTLGASGTRCVKETILPSVWKRWTK